MILPPETAFLADKSAQQVCSVLSIAGQRVYFVGGCVRNAILGSALTDIDIATDARPERVMALCEAAGLKAVPTGIAHGTITVVVGSDAYEVTTFRRDVETDGRRAVVAFSDQIEDDARRRDFTMNALYATPEGQIVDPLGGLPDARAGIVRFIEDAGARIREDYLRTLRFFRFWAWYGDQDAGFDRETLAQIAGHLPGLAQLSAERIGAEMLKLLAAPDPSQAIATMEQIGVLAQVMPIASAEVLPVLVHLEQDTQTPPDPIRRLAALGAEDATDRLRLSKSDSRDMQDLRAETGSVYGPKVMGQLLGAKRGWDAYLLKSASFAHPVDPDARALVRAGAQAVFPVQASDLMPKFEGAALGAELKRLRDIWIASDLTLDRDALLA